MLGCTVDYLVRYGLSVAIVAMVKEKKNSSQVSDACPAVIINGTDNSNTNNKSEGEFNWDVQQQGVILGIFFWGYFITKSTGGRISELLGAREVMAASLFISGVLCMACPLVAHVHPMALAALRFLMGLFQGPAFPALYCVLTKWAPPDELATMVTIAYSGMSIGSLIALGGSGWVVNALGWQWVFYGGGILALMWTPLWLILVSNDPERNMFITKGERELLLVNENIKPRRHVPWGKLLTCWRYYPSILAEVASSWVSNITATEGPTFLSSKMGLNMKQVSWVLATMQAGSWIGSFTFGRLSDILAKNYLSKLNTRRVIHGVGTLIISSGLLSIVLSGCDAWTVSALMVMVTTACSCSLSTFTLTPVDIAPNYAGTLSGLLGIGNISGFLAPIVTNQLLVLTGSWSSSVLLGAGLYLGFGIVYVTTTTATVQEWNYYEDLPGSDEVVEP